MLALFLLHLEWRAHYQGYSSSDLLLFHGWRSNHTHCLFLCMLHQSGTQLAHGRRRPLKASWGALLNVCLAWVNFLMPNISLHWMPFHRKIWGHSLTCQQCISLFIVTQEACRPLGRLSWAASLVALGCDFSGRDHPTMRLLACLGFEQPGSGTLSHFQCSLKSRCQVLKSLWRFLLILKNQMSLLDKWQFYSSYFLRIFLFSCTLKGFENALLWANSSFNKRFYYCYYYTQDLLTNNFIYMEECSLHTHRCSTK